MTMTAAENISTPNLREREHYQIVETLNFEFGVRFFLFDFESWSLC